MIVIGTILVSFDVRNTFNSKSKKRNLGVTWALLALFTTGLYFFLISFLVSSVGWFGAALLTTPLVILFMLVYGNFTKISLKPDNKNLSAIVIIAILNLAALLAYNLGVTYNYTTIVAPISAAAPAVTILLAILLLKEKLATDQKFGIILVLIGLILLSA